jgi:tetratricopeptide (TPR) repeat protein
VATGDYFQAGRRAYEAGWVHFLRGEAEAVLACADRAAAHWRFAQVGIPERAAATSLKGSGQRLRGDYPAAVEAHREALNLLRSEAVESPNVASALNSLAGAEQLAGDFAAAERDCREALRVARAVDDAEGMATCAGNLAEFSLAREDWPRAEMLGREALRLAETVGRQELIAADCRRIAEALVEQGRAAEGLPYAQRAVEIFTRLGSPSLKGATATLRKCES